MGMRNARCPSGSYPLSPGQAPGHNVARSGVAYVLLWLSAIVVQVRAYTIEQARGATIQRLVMELQTVIDAEWVIWD